MPSTPSGDQLVVNPSRVHNQPSQLTRRTPNKTSLALCCGVCCVNELNEQMERLEEPQTCPATSGGLGMSGPAICARFAGARASATNQVALALGAKSALLAIMQPRASWKSRTPAKKTTLPPKVARRAREYPVGKVSKPNVAASAPCQTTSKATLWHTRGLVEKYPQEIRLT